MDGLMMLNSGNIKGSSKFVIESDGFEEITPTVGEYNNYYKNTNEDTVDFDAVSLSIEYAKPDGNENLYLAVGQDLTLKNLVGEDGYFNVTISFLKKSSVQYEGDEATYTPTSKVLRKETYTLNEWIVKSRNYDLSQDGEQWEGFGGVGTPGFSIACSNGTVKGPASEGEAKITFDLYCKVLNGYQHTSLSFNIIVNTAWYTDTAWNEVELKPKRATKTFKASFEDGINTTVASSDDYLLVKATALDVDIASAISASNGTLTRKIDKATNEYHFFVGSFEVFGVMKNVLDGYTDNSVIPSNGEVILFHDYAPSVDGESNIEVLFPCYVKGNSEKINKCRLAKLFGNANAKNRLFVSGNPDYPNCDWHSSARNEYLDDGDEKDSNGDFTYFGDMDYCFYGQTDNAIMGYDNVATDKMVVLKSKSKVEPTNYFRTSSLIQAIDAGGNALTGVDGSALYRESFPLATGNIGAGAMNDRSVTNLNGDTLYLSSENTICGLDIAGQVGDSQRISYSRSRYIDPELKELDLSDAVLWTDNNNLCLFTKEATYLTHYETFNGDTNQYEWFKADVKDVRCAIEIDGTIYFGSGNGGLYRFESESYDDVDKIDVSVGGTLYGNDQIAYNSAINSKISTDDIMTFKIKTATIQETLFRKVANVSKFDGLNVDLTIDAETNSLKILAHNQEGRTSAVRYKELVEELAYGGFFYFDKPDGENSIQTTGESDIEVYAPFKLVPVDEAIDEYKVVDGDTEDEIDLSTLEGANLCRPLDGEYEITDLDKENCNFKISHNGRVVNVILYADQDMANLSFPSEIRKHSYVKARFITAPAVLGGISYRKTIWAWTMTASDKPNDLKVCQATNEERFEDMKQMAFSENIPIGLDFKQLTFMSLDFGKSAIPRKYTYFRPLSVPFISFGFKSGKPANSILTAVAITYSVPMLGWGNK